MKRAMALWNSGTPSEPLKSSSLMVKNLTSAADGRFEKKSCSCSSAYSESWRACSLWLAIPGMRLLATAPWRLPFAKAGTATLCRELCSGITMRMSWL